MLVIDEDTLYGGEIYRAVLGQGNSDEEYIQFLQPRSKRLKCQVMHDNALDYLFELEEDIGVSRAVLEPDSETSGYF